MYNLGCGVYVGSVLGLCRAAGEAEPVVRVEDGEPPVPASDGGHGRPCVSYLRRGPRQPRGGIRGPRTDDPSKDPSLPLPPAIHPLLQIFRQNSDHPFGLRLPSFDCRGRSLPPSVLCAC